MSSPVTTVTTAEPYCPTCKRESLEVIDTEQAVYEGDTALAGATVTCTWDCPGVFTLVTPEV